MATKRKNLIVAVTGASGSLLAERALELLSEIKSVDVHLCVTKSAEKTMEHEIGEKKSFFAQYAKAVYAEDDMAAAISSGSFETAGMLVVPCSMKTLSAVANGYDDTLVARAASVTLKERRPLVLMTREAPLTLAQIRNMESVTQMGGIVFPPVMTFYLRECTLDAMVTQSVLRALSLIGIRHPLLESWK